LVYMMRKTSHKFWNWITRKMHFEPKPKITTHLKCSEIKVLVIKNKASRVRIMKN
jgi:hypothetical protein